MLLFYGNELAELLDFCLYSVVFGELSIELAYLLFEPFVFLDILIRVGELIHGVLHFTAYAV